MQILQYHPNFSAIFCYNVLLAIGDLKACRKIHRKIPDDCAMVGFDDISISALVYPLLTIVPIDQFALGHRAGFHLLEMIDHPEKLFDPILLDVNLVVRDPA